VVEIKTAGEIEAIRAAGQVVAQILATVRAQAAVGMRLADLDEAARCVLATAGATSPFLGYQPSFAPIPFPAVICTSVNDAALHGIPGSYRLADGDLLSVDCGAVLDGWAADAAISFTIEPWFLAGGADSYRIDRDGWTIRSADGSRAAHIEHTVAVTADGPLILTTP
jgi:methionyl aminopeptidase